MALQFLTRSAVVALLLLLASCRESAEKADAPKPQPTFQLAAPIAIDMEQRQVRTIPGTDGQLILTIDDITGGQVLAGVTLPDGSAALAQASMTEGKVRPFEHQGATLELELRVLQNNLVGQDYALFVLRTPGQSLQIDRAGTDETIRKLIDSFDQLINAKFVRQGQEHSASEAKAHLELKWMMKRDVIITPEQFIEDIASGSSTDGSAYLIRPAGGGEVTVREWLEERLAEFRKDAPPAAKNR